MQKRYKIYYKKLKEIEVIGCPKLKKLPLDSSRAMKDNKEQQTSNEEKENGKFNRVEVNRPFNIAQSIKFSSSLKEIVNIKTYILPEHMLTSYFQIHHNRSYKTRNVKEIQNESQKEITCSAVSPAKPGS
ncbi:hypothetical protein CUMW_261450 [Citrus unshiu]|uniref:Uncharacterized protein n=1 Tax=Citrus unshiu TaxID=55188 RepID=A0A2H5QU09_CITUN|nr:hypothetical protein CUMW_261450 [Citrus unshiu]